MRLVTTYFLVCVLYIIHLPASYGCSCVPFDVETSFGNAYFVFEAYLTESRLVAEISGEVSPWERDGGPYVIGDFVVVKSWKGDPSSLNGVITHSESSACGITLAAGRTYIFFVYDVASDRGVFKDRSYGVVSICGGPYSEDQELPESTRRWLNGDRRPGT